MNIEMQLGLVPTPVSGRVPEAAARLQLDARRFTARHLAVCCLAGTIAAAAPAQVVRFTAPTDSISVPLQTLFSFQATFEARLLIPPEGAPGGTLYHEQFNAAEDKTLRVVDNGVSGHAWTSFAYEQRPHLVTTGPINDGLWHHVAFVRDGGEERMYLDGAMVDSAPWSEAIANSASSGPLALGATQFSYNTTAPLVRVDWLRVSDTARYSGPTAAIPTCEPAADAGTLFLFLFNEPAGSPTAVDSGPAAANGTLGAGFPTATSPVFEESASQNGMPSFTQPQSALACPTAAAQFSVAPVGPGPFTYRWQIQSAPPLWSDLQIAPFPLPCGGAAYASTPAAAQTLVTVAPCPGVGTYQIRCIVSSACGSVISSEATYTARCYANCDCTTTAPVLNVSDFVCFLNKYAAGDPYANCDGSTTAPVLNVNDFICFQTKYAAGCP